MFNAVPSASRLPFQTFEIGDHSLDHFQPYLPEGGIARVEPKWREQFGMMFRAPRRKHREIAFGKTFARALIDAIQRIHETIAERIGVDIKGRVDEMRDIGPIALVVAPKLDRGPEAFGLLAHP